jgi:hypothetical protein
MSTFMRNDGCQLGVTEHLECSHTDDDAGTTTGKAICNCPGVIEEFRVGVCRHGERQQVE